MPEWLFTIGWNGFWWPLAAVGGLAAVMAGRRRARMAVTGFVLMTLATMPDRLGLSPSWMLPPFAFVIALWLPVGVGLAFLVDLVHTALWPRGRQTSRALRGLAVLSVVLALAAAWSYRSRPPAALDPRSLAVLAATSLGLALAVRGASRLPRSAPVGGRGRRGRSRWAVAGILVLALTATVSPTGLARQVGQLAGRSWLPTAPADWFGRDVLNRGLVLLTPADLAAADWVRRSTPQGAHFLVGTTDWQLGTYRGIDGGYWLPLLAGRTTTMPSVFYNYGDTAYGLAVAKLAERVSRAGSMDDRELSTLLQDTKVDYIYFGPAAASVDKALSAERLARLPGTQLAYDRDGVQVYRYVPGGGAAP